MCGEVRGREGDRREENGKMVGVYGDWGLWKKGLRVECVGWVVL